MINILTYDNTFTAYQKRGYEFDILMAVDKNVRPWLLTKYCNCLYGKSKRSKFDFVIDGGEWFADEDVFIIDVIRAKKNISLSFQNNLFNIIIERLKNGSYVYGYFDEYYINSKSAYQNYHFKHSFLVYGYENNARLFYAIGYTDNAKFDKYSIPYDEFMLALTSLKQIELTFVCVNSKFNFEARIKPIYYGLYDYYHSINTRGMYDPNVIYGIDTLYEFSKYVQEKGAGQKNLDLRYSKFFFEFKRFMLERLTYLGDNGYICSGYKEYSDICKDFEVIHMLFIKYNMTHNQALTHKICEMVDNTILIERRILSMVLFELKKTLVEHNNQNYI